MLSDAKVSALKLDSALMSSEDEEGVSHPPVWRRTEASKLFKRVGSIINVF